MYRRKSRDSLVEQCSEIYTILFRLEILAQLCIGYSSRKEKFGKCILKFAFCASGKICNPLVNDSWNSEFINNDCCILNYRIFVSIIYIPKFCLYNTYSCYFML